MMKLFRNRTLFISLLIFLPLSALAQNIGISSENTGSCNTGNSENVGQHIIDYVLCGASVLHPKATLFGTLSLVLNTICLMITLYLISINGIKYIAFTMQYGVPGGQKIQGGMMVIRSGLLATLLAPIIANGFSPIQVIMRNFTELGAYFGDIAAERVVDFISSEGSITSVDPSNIEEVTEQIIASEMCARLFYLHHKQDVTTGAIPSESLARAVKPITRIIRSDIVITWDYFDPFSTGNANDNWFSEPLKGIENQSKGNVCGSLNVKIPEAIKGLKITNPSSNGFSINNAMSWQKPYGEVLNAQYSAVNNHILNVRNILNSLDEDLVTITIASAKASLNSNDAATIDDKFAAQDAEISQGQNIASSASAIVNRLIAANASYREAIAKIGAGAASQVNKSNNIVSSDCDADLSPTSIAAPCVEGESWEQQLKRQGFAALGTYYFVYMTINQKIIGLQEHLISPSFEVPFYASNFGAGNVTLTVIKKSETSQKLVDRSNSILGEFRSHVDSSKFNMHFSAVENLGNTAEETESNSALGEFRKYLGGLWNEGKLSVTRWATNGLKDPSKNLILRLIDMGMIFGNIGSGILGLAFIGFLAMKLAPAGKLAQTAGNIAKTRGADADGKGGFSGGSIILWVGLIFWALSGLMQYGIPSVPMFKWLLELQSWAIMMFMAFIYAPLWIMAHAAITDDRFMAEQTMTGYGLLFELMLRPLLMVFSFFAMLLLLHIADIGFQMMLSYLLGMMSLGGSAVVGLFFTILIALITAYQLSMRTFDVMAQLPDFIISRINFGARPLGDTSNDSGHSKFFALGMRLSHAGASSVLGSGAKAMGLISKTGAPKKE